MSLLIEVNRVENVVMEVEKALLACGYSHAADILRAKFAEAQECIYDAYYTERQKNYYHIIRCDRLVDYPSDLLFKGDV